MQTQVLDPALIPLSGSHLIEASAGTGKTYNITKIYLRLLLEKSLSVKEILVMTFTKAATEEIRSRIRKEINLALNQWQHLVTTDPFYQALAAKIDTQQAARMLNNALLHMDEASIFTIHGFCSRVLTEQAFASGIDFAVSMEADLSEVMLEAVRDWYRITHSQQDDINVLVTEKWQTPEAFYQAFYPLFTTEHSLQGIDETKLNQQFGSLKQAWRTQLQALEAEVFGQCISGKKDANDRQQEWQCLLAWADQTDLSEPPAEVKKFCHGNRLRGISDDSPVKQVLNFDYKSLEEARKKAQLLADDADVYQGVLNAIQAIKHSISIEKNRQNVMGFDDLILCLNQQLNHSGAQASKLANLVRKQYPAALIDEFQDTDPQQYQILSALYLNKNTDNSDTVLYLIGDPKQAIYGFRGGDIFTYLTARAHVEQRWMMDTNWRSSAAMVSAYNRLFYGDKLPNPKESTSANSAVFGFDIDYAPVNHAEKNHEPRLADNSKHSALSLNYFSASDDHPARNTSGNLKVEFRADIAKWVALEINRLLQQASINKSKIKPNNIAILVKDKTEAAAIRQALADQQLKSVYVSAKDNVFLSDEAKHLYVVLKAIAEPENDSHMVAALATPLFSCSPAQLYQLQHDDMRWQQWREVFMSLNETWQHKSFIAMALSILHKYTAPAAEQKERQLTNYIHLFELLQKSAQIYHQPEQLLHHFQQQIFASVSATEAELRLESDAALIQIVTQHGSKGLEYPIVFVPFVSLYKDPTRFGLSLKAYFSYFDLGKQQKVTQLGAITEAIENTKLQDEAESIRLLYVAITRAIDRCYLAVCDFEKSEHSPLALALQLTDKSQWPTVLADLANSSNETISLTCIEQIEHNQTGIETNAEPPTLSAATFGGKIERNWWLTSFSALTRLSKYGGLSSPEHSDDLTASEIQVASSDIRYTLTKGSQTGSLLHDIMEHADFSNPLWSELCHRTFTRYGTTLTEQETSDFYQWLDDVVSCELLPSMSLSTLAKNQSIREVEFYFPLEDAQLTALYPLLKNFRQSNTLSQQLLLPSLAYKKQIQGMLHGFIDLIFEWQGKYYVADYKSTHLGNGSQHYHHQALQQNIDDNFYDLQYLIYSLALHKFLKHKLADYDVETHFGGVFYLYMRGMQPGSKNGIYFKAIDADTLNRLQQILENPSSAS